MNIKSLFLLICACLQGSPCGSYRILVFLPIPFKSHIVPFQSLSYELAARGHRVTEVSAFTPTLNHSNYHHHAIPPAYEAGSFDVLQFRHATGHSLVRMFSDYCLLFSEKTLKLPEVQSFIQNDKSQYDVIFVSATFCAESLSSLGHKYNAPIINFQPLGYRPSSAYILGSLLPPTTMIDFRQPHSSRMTFLQTLSNVYMFFADLYDMHFYYHPRVEDLMRKYITYPGVETRPDLHTLLRNLSLTFIEYEPTIGIPHAIASNVQFTGGLQLRDGQPLPQELDRFMSDAPNGVVYVSLGSLIQFSNLPKSSVDAFVEAFKRLKYRIIWKADVKVPVAENVLVDKWFPQTDILGHPNCKAFITHGGIHSAMETGYLGVPVVMVPGFSDQFQNVKVMEDLGMGVMLDLDTMTADTLFNAVEEVITDPKYKARLESISRSMRSAPMSNLEKAVRWTEFVAENRGAPFLRAESRNLSVMRAIGLDLLLGMGLLVLLVVGMIVLVLKRTMSFIRFLRENKEKSD